MPDHRLRICALYPDVMNIYADRGNLAVLEQRCRWRGIDVAVSRVGHGDSLDPEAFDIIYLGGGQDRDQALVADDLVATKKSALHEAAAGGVLVLGICGGIQLLGHSYELAEREIPGAGLLDLTTVRSDGPRLIGNIAIEVDLDDSGRTEVLAGFENHAGRTLLGTGTRPLGRVLKGHGNNGTSGHEGAHCGTVIGTYLHGPLLPKNVWFADWLIAKGLDIPADELTPLDDELERAAHREACVAAGVGAAR